MPQALKARREAAARVGRPQKEAATGHGPPPAVGAGAC